MKMFWKTTVVLALAVALWATSGVFAATDTQLFTVTVPSALTVSGPADVSIAHNGTDSENSFSAQTWTVSQNQLIGSTVTFAVSTAFRNASAPTVYKRNCRLTLAIASSESAATWALLTATDVTDYANVVPDETASVGASSLLAGDATFSLTVGLVTSDYSTMATGSYTTTVTGTLTAD